MDHANALKYYSQLLKVKPKKLQSRYPFSSMDAELVQKTLKRIELVYQDLTPEVSAFVRGDRRGRRTGGGGGVTVITS